MWGNTKTFKIVYWDNNATSADKRRATFYEALDRNDAIYKFQQDYGNSTIVRECKEMNF
jgi:hypothetical protein